MSDRPDRPRPVPTRHARADPIGQVLPERARDEDGLGWGEPGYDDDERLRREVPPHHG